MTATPDCTRDDVAAPDLGELRDGFRNLLPLIVKRLGSLPTLPGLRAQALRVLAREGVPVPEASRIVACDPALTAKVLKVINSPVYGLRYRVSTLSHALAMLGPGVLGRIVSGIRPLLVDEDSAPIWTHLWCHGLATAHAARTIAIKTGYDLPEEAFTAGILHDLGESVFLLYGPKAVRRARVLAQETGRSLLDAERQVFGIDHSLVGSMIAERWNLPRLLRDVIRHHHDAVDDVPMALDAKNRELIGIVAAADRLATAAGHGMEETAAEAVGTLVIGGALELTDVEVRSIRAEVETALGDALESLGATDLAVRQLLRRPSDPAPEVAVPGDSSGVSLAERLSLLGALLRQLRRLNDPDEILPRAFEGLQAHLGFDRAFYLEAAAGRHNLTGRHFFDGTPVRIEMRDLDLDLGTHPGLLRALDTGEAVLLRTEEDPEPALSLMGVRELAAAGLTIHGKTDGLILVDTFFTDRELAADDAALLEALALGVGLLVENRGLGSQTRRLRLLAEKDELMGINNRRSLMQLLEKEVERARIRVSPLAVVMIDVDHFKSWNDVYGHQVGDRILKSLAEVVQTTSRDTDVIGRYGGEEFLVVLPDTRQDAGIIYAERLRRAVEHLYRDLELEFPDVPLTLSMGVAELQEDESIEILIRRVDKALYAAKRRGRDRVCAGS